MFLYGSLFGFVMCMILFEMVRKGYFQWAGRSRVTRDAVQKLVKECSTWAIMSQQDKSPLLALIHANYAVSHIYALQQIATPEFIYEATSVHIDKLESEVTNLQKLCSDNLIREHPEISPPGNVFNDALQSLYKY